MVYPSFVDCAFVVYLVPIRLMLFHSPIINCTLFVIPKPDSDLINFIWGSSSLACLQFRCPLYHYYLVLTPLAKTVRFRRHSNDSVFASLRHLTCLVIFHFQHFSQNFVHTTIYQVSHIAEFTRRSSNTSVAVLGRPLQGVFVRPRLN